MNLIKKNLISSLHKKEYLIGAATGSGMVARCCQMFGADLIFITNSGKFRQNGHSSLCGYMPYENANDTTYHMTEKEILPIINTIPMIVGINAADTTCNIPDLINQYSRIGVLGIANYPTVTSIDGNYRQALEQNGFSFKQEVELIHYAHEHNLFTVAFVMNFNEIEPIITAGADMICIDFGLTHGGLFGSSKNFTIRDAAIKTEPIYSFAKHLNPKVLFAVYGGPLVTPADMHLFYKFLPVDVFIGGSSFERIPLEETYHSLFNAFKIKEASDTNIYSGLNPQINYIDYCLKYIESNYYSQFTLGELADSLHLSEPYLSHLFRAETGITFSNYVKKFRIDKAIEFMSMEDLTLLQISEFVGYMDYAHFSKTFHTVMGVSPKNYRADILTKKSKEN